MRLSRLAPLAILSLTLLVEARYAGAQSSSSAPPSSGPSAAPVSRNHEVIEALHRSGAVPRCWNAFIQHSPEAPSARFRVRVEVDASAAVHDVVIIDPIPTLLAGCVRNELRRATVPAGSAITISTTYSFAAGAPAPIPGH